MSEKKDTKRVLARVLADELKNVTGGMVAGYKTAVVTGGNKDITNLAGDNDGEGYLY